MDVDDDVGAVSVGVDDDANEIAAGGNAGDGVDNVSDERVDDLRPHVVGDDNDASDDD